TPFDARLMSPLRPVLYVLVLCVPVWFLRRWISLPAVIGGVVVVALLIAGPAVHSAYDSVVHEPPRGGSDVMARALRGIPRGTFIATNAPDWVYLSTRRPSIFTPPRLFPVTKERNQHFDADVRELG